MPFTQQMQAKEALVRGTYLSISCDFERLMVDLIIMAEYEKGSRHPKTLNDKRKITRDCSMGEKLRRCKTGMRKHSEHYKYLGKHFRVINKLTQMRNMLAHGFSEFDNKQKVKDYIVFRYVDNNYVEHADKIMVQPFLALLEKYRKSIVVLYEFNLKFYDELSKL